MENLLEGGDLRSFDNRVKVEGFRLSSRAVAFDQRFWATPTAIASVLRS